MHISLAAEKLFEVFGFPITNTLLMAWLAMAVLGSAAFLFSRAKNEIPGRLQALAEIVFEALLALCESVTQDRKKAERFLPIVVTIFLFVVSANWMGILPFVGSVGFEEHGAFIPFFRSTFSDLNNTLALAFIAVAATQAFGIASIGFFRYAGKFLSFGGPLQFFVGILESIGECAKILSFSFRLFGNIFAGEVLLAVIGFLAPFVVPVPFLGLELFVGFIQALVFAMLTLVFLTMATVEFEH